MSKSVKSQKWKLCFDEKISAYKINVHAYLVSQKFAAYNEVRFCIVSVTCFTIFNFVR